jgi:mannose-6-phosphate isomerase-like protein (cupin superfamily)
MKVVQTSRLRSEFEPLVATKKGQAACMRLWPGEKSDEEVGNEHPRSEQWLYVVAGAGTATVVPVRGQRRSVKIRRGTLLVIEPGELHQIKNTSQRPLLTINFYLPPAYRSDGQLRRRPRASK